MTGMSICGTCGRPPESVCDGCLIGSPPPERLADMQAERQAAWRRRVEKLRAETERGLAEIPELYALAPLFTQPGTGSDDDRRPSTSPARPPLSLGVLDLLDEREKPDADPVRGDYDLDRRAGARRQGVLPTLASWVRLVDGELHDDDREHDPPSDTPTVASECDFLFRHLDWAAEQQWFEELATEVATIRRDLRDAVHEVDPMRLTCTVPGCGWGVVQEGKIFRCTGCGKTTSELEARRMVERARPKTLRQCADQIQVSERTLRKLVAAGELRHFALGDGKTRLYQPHDVSAAWARWRLLARAE